MPNSMFTLDFKSENAISTLVETIIKFVPKKKKRL